jgi:hypothetical protein
MQRVTVVLVLGTEQPAPAARPPRPNVEGFWLAETAACALCNLTFETMMIDALGWGGPACSAHSAPQVTM